MAEKKIMQNKKANKPKKKILRRLIDQIGLTKF